MKRFIWKENHVLSIKIKDNLYVLAQLVGESPLIAFFNFFSESNEWDNIELHNSDVLFVANVARDCIKRSGFYKVSNIDACKEIIIPLYWISIFAGGSRFVKFQSGTNNEVEFITLGDEPGGRLIEVKVGMGVYDNPVIEKSINDNAIIDCHELTSLRVYPELNERLYLCHKLSKSIDPAKDIAFNRHLPDYYENYVKIVSGKFLISELGY